MRLMYAVSSVMLFILVFDDVEGKKKDYKDYNLPYGPKKHEEGKYIYQPLIGDPQYCMYCPLKTLTNSKYSDQQQLLCLKKYQHKNLTEELLPQEIQNRHYPLCDIGKVPGCGAPPEVNKTKNHMWVCDPGYSLTKYSVYFTCALVCNISDKVDWQYYCNESLQWEAVRPSKWQKCEAPVAAEPQDNHITIIVIIVGSVVAGVILTIAACCFYRQYQKSKRDDQNNQRNNNIELGALPHENGRENDNVQDNEDAGNINENGGENEHVEDNVYRTDLQLLQQSRSYRQSFSSQTSGSRTPDCLGSSLGSKHDDDNRPLIPPLIPPIPAAAACPEKGDNNTGTSDKSSGSNENEMDTETSKLLPLNVDAPHDEVIHNLDDLGAVGGCQGGDASPRVDSRNKDNTRPKGKPSVQLIEMKDGKKVRSIPLQGDIYSIEKGSYFHVVPNSPDGSEIKQFKIERKDDDRPFKWDIYSKFYFIPSASELDAGLFMWKMVLDNNEEYTGCFEITIFFPVRPTPLGEEAQTTGTSIRNTTNPVGIPHQQPSSTSHLKIGSLLESVHPNNDIIVHNVQNPPVRGENFIRETNLSNDPFRNADPLSSEMFRGLPNDNRNHLDSGLDSSDRPRFSRSSDLASNRPLSQRHNQSDNSRALDMRYSTSGYESQTSASLAREQFRANINNLYDLNIASFDALSDRIDDSRMSSPGSDFVLDSNLRSGIRNPSEEVDELDTSARARPDPAGNVSPVCHSESNDYLDQTNRKVPYVANETQQPFPQQQHGNDGGGGDVDSISDRLDSVVLERDFLVSNPEHGEDVNRINENTYPRAEIQELPYRLDNEVENNLEHHVDLEDITDDVDSDETKL